MATTTWIAGSGDWNTASNWSGGVPTAADDAVFADNKASGGTYTVTGDGLAASLTITPDPGVSEPFFAGALAVGRFVDDAVFAHLAGTAALASTSATIAAGARFEVQAGATLGSGTLALDDGILTGTLGVLANPVVLAGSNSVTATGTLAGAITGTGLLKVTGNVVLTNPGNTYSGGTVLGPASIIDVGGVNQLNHLEIATPGAAGTGPVAALGGTLTLDRGVVVPSVTAAFLYTTEIDATDQTTTVFAGQMPLAYNNGAGHATIVGAIQPGLPFTDEGPSIFGSMTVQGGTGSVTVFGGNSTSLLYGGTAGGNVLIAGADLSAYPSGEVARGFVKGPDFVAYAPGGSTLFAGGGNDLLVASGTDNNGFNTLLAAGGSETLTGAGSTGRNLFFGGTGADVIVAGGGASTVVAGPGAATISGGSGAAAIFAGAGSAVVLGGSGADYVQAGAGNATLFAGAGMDIVGVVSGQAGGSLVVSGFRAGIDRVSAQGYAAGPVVASGGGSTVLTFSDQTRVTLLGVASLPGGVAS
ncbi:MAG: beta strand repeat-containing protein [Janthinobacterium lividum]